MRCLFDDLGNGQIWRLKVDAPHGVIGMSAFLYELMFVHSLGSFWLIGEFESGRVTILVATSHPCFLSLGLKWSKEVARL